MRRSHSTLREYFEALLIAGIFLGFTNTFLIKTFYIPSSSMEDTLLVGDHLFVNRFVYGQTATPLERSMLPLRSVERGDIVIFRSPEEPSIDMVKRCIGVPGDEIRVVDKELYINGEWIDDAAFTRHRDPRVLRGRRDNFGPFEVPEGEYFCMGDNRDNSNDSRFWGTVPAHFVKGRALLVYWSFGGQTSDGTWRGLGPKLRQLGATAIGFFSKTRWNRMLHVIR
ncbi:MAG: signal peptidase I [Thermoanaerobaculia bacterium]|nr:signal peptidase I [Thermoanaerobaculia bacterium]